MRGVKLALLYALCAPWNLGAAALSLLLFALGTRRPRWHLGVAWLDVRDNARLLRSWGYSIALGHVVLLQPGLSGTAVEAHELVHVRQFEGAVCSLWLAVTTALLMHLFAGNVAAMLSAGLLGPWWSYFGASLSAWLRCERPYLDSHFERHARAEVSLEGTAVGDAPPVVENLSCG